MFWPAALEGMAAQLEPRAQGTSTLPPSPSDMDPAGVETLFVHPINYI